MPEGEPSPVRTGRRGLLLGAGAVGAAAVAAGALHRGVIAEAAVAAVPAAAEGEGYRLTPHVLRYYETTKA
ncbi:MAG: formate dehydrogenase [Burkholderiales bacterium]|nr:formate dehydrogenase [Burkholderiales bacterium]